MGDARDRWFGRVVRAVAASALLVVVLPRPAHALGRTTSATHLSPANGEQFQAGERTVVGVDVVRPTGTDGAAPSGSVTLLYDGRPVGEGTLEHGTIWFRVMFDAGRHRLDATYAGDANFAPSQDTKSIDVVIGRTVADLGSSPSGSICPPPGPCNPPTTRAGDPLTLLLNLYVGDSNMASPYREIPTTVHTEPTGTVVFIDGRDVLGEVAVYGRETRFTTTKPAPGTHAFSARYSGDRNFKAAESSLVFLRVLPRQLLPSVTIPSVTIPPLPGIHASIPPPSAATTLPSVPRTTTSTAPASRSSTTPSYDVAAPRTRDAGASTGGRSLTYGLAGGLLAVNAGAVGWARRRRLRT